MSRNLILENLIKACFTVDNNVLHCIAGHCYSSVLVSELYHWTRLLKAAEFPVMRYCSNYAE